MCRLQRAVTHRQESERVRIGGKLRFKANKMQNCTSSLASTGRLQTARQDQRGVLQKKRSKTAQGHSKTKDAKSGVERS